MKLVLLLSIVFCFGVLNAQAVNPADPGLQMLSGEKRTDTAGFFVHPNPAYKYIQREQGISSDCCEGRAYPHSIDPNLPPGDRGANYDTATGSGDAPKKDDGVK